MRPVLALVLIVAPAFAEDPPVPAEDDGFSLMEQGMKLVMQGMLAEMEPAIDGMEEALKGFEPSLHELGPKLMSILSLVDDIGNYDMPVKLPNGDILIRRNVPLVPKMGPQADPLPGPNGEIEL